MKFKNISLNFLAAKDAICYVALATVIYLHVKNSCEKFFSHVKISYFRVKAHLVFHWCVYNKTYLSLYFLEYVTRCLFKFLAKKWMGLGELLS